MFGLTKTEAYIRANETETLCLTDASSLQYIQRTKNFSSKVFNYSVYISSLPRLSILYVPGQSLLLCDALTRAAQDEDFTDSAELSRTWAQFIPPIKSELGVKLNPEQVTDFLLSDPKQEAIDTFPKRYQYHQNIHLSHIKSYEQRLPSELELLIGLYLGFDNTAVLNTQVWWDLAKMKGNLSQSQQAQIIKLNNLQKIKTKIESLQLPQKLMQDLLLKYPPP